MKLISVTILVLIFYYFTATTLVTGLTVCSKDPVGLVCNNRAESPKQTCMFNNKFICCRKYCESGTTVMLLSDNQRIHQILSDEEEEELMEDYDYYGDNYEENYFEDNFEEEMEADRSLQQIYKYLLQKEGY
ncbi:hypothetical protein ABK040_011052 [Willaertia magna]